MKIKKEIIFRYLQLSMESILKFCLVYFYGFLVIEMVYLSIKIYSFDLLSCMLDGIQTNINLEDQQIVENVKLFCWTLGYFKDRFIAANNLNGPNLHLIVYAIPTDKDIILWQFNERHFIDKMVILHFCMFLLQILLYLVQKQVNFFNKTIKRLKDRSLSWYCDHDRQKLKFRIRQAINGSNLYFKCELSIQLIYQSLLFGSIISTKLFLSGQYPLHKFSWENLILFPQITPLKSVHEKPAINVKNILLIDQTFRRNLNQAFEHFWFVFLILFATYIFFMLVKILNFLIHSFRTYSILLYSPDADRMILEVLTSKIGNYYFLFKVAKEISRHYFAEMINEVFYVKGIKYPNEISEQDDQLSVITSQRQIYSINDENGSSDSDFVAVKSAWDTKLKEKFNCFNPINKDCESLAYVEKLNNQEKDTSIVLTNSIND